MSPHLTKRRTSSEEIEEKRMRALIEAGMAVASERSLDTVLQRVVEVACEVMEAKYAALGVIGNDGTLAQFVFSGISEAEARAIGELPTGKGILGLVLNEAKPLRLRDLTQHPHSVGFPAHHPPMKSFLGVPIMARGKVFGRLYLAEKQRAEEFTDEDEAVALTLAAQAAVAVENAQLYENYRELTATLEQRVSERTEELEEKNRSLAQTNEELARLQALHAAIVRSIPSSILIFDASLNLLYANDTYFHQWQRSNDAIGKNLHELLPPEVLEREHWEEMAREALATGMAIARDAFPHHSPARGDTVISFHLTRLEGKTPEEHKLLLMMDDVTERETLQRQLVQSEKLAAMGLLSAGVAHEIRTPLSVIRLAAYDVKEMLNDGQKEAREQLELIEKNVLDCNRIIENLLTYARETRPEPRYLDVNFLVESCLSIAEKEIALQNVRVERQLGEVPQVFAGENDLKQVFSNIMLNAVQAMPEGGVLTIATWLAGTAVAVRIADTGMGIPEHVLDHIFDPFYTTKEPGKGTGLGLSICRKIVAKMNGMIEVQSEVGKGTAFTVKIPVEVD